MEEFKDEKRLSLSALFIITGLSCLLFTLVMKFLDGVTLQVFFKTGITCTSIGILLFALKSALHHLPERNKARNTPQ